MEENLQEQKKVAADPQKSSDEGQKASGASDVNAKNAQMTQGVDLGHGAVSETLASGESAKDGNNPYGTFNYYRSDGKLGSSYFGLIEGKPIYELSFQKLYALSQSGSTLDISYTDGDKPRMVNGRLFALGKYQMIPSTRESARKAVGLKESDLFSPENQDLLFTKSLIQGAVMDYITGKNDDLAAAAKKLAQTWAAVGIQPGTVNNYGHVGGDKGLTSYYQGDGLNNASISYNAICEALKADRAAVKAGGVATQTVSDKPATTTSAPTSTVEGNVDKAAEQAEKRADTAPQASVNIDVNRAVRINKSYGYGKAKWKEIQRTVGLSGTDVDGIVGKVTSNAIAQWQASHGFTGNDIDGICGPATLAKMSGDGAVSADTTETAPAKEEDKTVTPTNSDDSSSVDQNQSFKFFSLAELTRSDTAKAQNIDNSIPNKAIENNLRALIVNVLDPLREAYGSPITVNSGYRCEKLNEAVGGVENSQHKSGQAADLTAGSKSANVKLFKLVKKLHDEQGLQYDQCINEGNGGWMHISYKTSGNRNSAFAIPNP